MPELPEVETIRRGLEDRVIGRKISDVEVMASAKTNFSNEELQAHVVGQKFTGVTRRGKVLIWSFGSGYSLLIHLKMTGQVILDSPEGESVSRFAGGHPTKSMDLVVKLPDSSTRAVFRLEDGSVIYFNDQRKFGWIKLMKTEEIEQESLIARLGPEPNTFSEQASKDHVQDRMSRTSRVVKAALLDQEVMAGVGNIYADEALHLAKIHPEIPANQLSPDQVQELMNAVAVVIEQSIELGGTSFTNYVNVLGTRGDYLESSRVFKREGLACHECGTEIIKTRVAGRGTHICVKCQVR